VGGASGSYDIVMMNDPNTVFANIMTLSLIFPSSFFSISAGSTVTVEAISGFQNGLTITASTPLDNKVNIDFTTKETGQSSFMFRLSGVTNPIYETSPMEITASFLNGSGGSLASTETFSMSANFSALDLQSSPGLLYSSDIIYTPAQLRLTFVPLAKIHAGSKIKVKLPALYTHDGTSYHIPQVTSTVFCTSIAGISGTLGCTYSTSDNY